jgi:hypothetical protein
MRIARNHEEGIKMAHALRRQRPRRPWVAVSMMALVLGSTAAPAASAAVQASLQASRSTGPAPLAVFFDATGSTDTTSGLDTFRQLGYAFSFGDSNSGNWAISGEPKGSQRGGPLAAHVFDTPGSYVVRVRAQNAAGEFSDTTAMITVQDPNTVYSGTSTVCVSSSGNYAGCPPGATRQTSLPSSYDGKRVLLRRGESFGAIQIAYADDAVIVGPYGSGTKPRVSGVQIGSNATPTIADFPDDITIMDLDIANGIRHFATGSRFLLYRNNLDDTQASANNSIDIGGAFEWFAGSDSNRVLPQSAFVYPREIFIVENRVIGTTDSDQLPSMNFSALGSRIVLLGNDMGRAFYHTARPWRLHKSVIAHNALRGQSSDGQRVALKLHSGGLGAYDESYAVSGSSWATTQIVIANNLFGDPSDNNSWTVVIAPQNNESAEGIQDVIVENNRFVRGPNTITDLRLAGRRITTRGNVFSAPNSFNIVTLSAGGPYFNLPSSWLGPYFTEVAPILPDLISPPPPPVLLP